MRGILMAGLALALMTTQAQAWTNNCTSNCGQAAVDNGQAQAQQQHQSQNAYGGKGGTAYGGAGGAGGAGGSGGNGYGGAASATGGSASATGGNASSTASSSSGGNSFDMRSAPGFGVASPAAGPCSGFSGGFSVSTLMGGGGVSIGEVEKDCRKDQHIIIGLSDAATHDQAAHEWYAMDADLFGHANADPHAPALTSSTSATPAAILPQQTADASPAPYCNANWPTVIKMQHGCQ